jgi:hypothetical protein
LIAGSRSSIRGTRHEQPPSALICVTRWLRLCMRESERQLMGMVAHRKLRRRTPRRPPQCPDDLLDYAPLRPRHRSLSQSRVRPHGSGAECRLALRGRPPKNDLSTRTVTDDWPNRVAYARRLEECPKIAWRRGSPPRRGTFFSFFQ